MTGMIDRVSQWMQSPIFWLCCWVALAIANEQLAHLITALGKLAADPWERLAKALEGLSGGVANASGGADRATDALAKATRDLLAEISGGLKAGASSLRVHLQDLLHGLEPDKAKRGWRIVGSLISLLALVAFVYADMAQGANNLSAFVPDAAIPEWLQSLVMPLLMASAGTAAILGLIIGDCIGMTHFTPHGESRWRWGILGISVVNLIVSVTCSSLIALKRVEFFATLSPARADLWNTLASYAQSFLIAPLLLTTVLLFWSWTGVIVVYGAVVGVLSLFLALNGYLVDVLRKLVEWGAVGSEVVLGILLAIVRFAISSLAVSLTVVFSAVRLFFQLLEALVSAILYPPLWVALVIGKAIELFRSLQARRSNASDLHDKAFPPGHPHIEQARRNLEVVRQEQASRATGEPESGT